MAGQFLTAGTRLSWANHLAEDDTLSDRQKVVQADQRVVLGVLVLAVEVELCDGVHGDFVPLQLDLVRTRCEVVDMGLDLVTKRGRKQYQLAVGRQSPIGRGVSLCLCLRLRERPSAVTF